MKKNRLQLMLLVAAAAALLLAAAGCGTASSSEETVTGTPVNAGLPQIKLVAPGATGAGEVPAFEWEAVPGAARYRLVAVGADGRDIWAWNGSDTKVNLGGLPGDRPPDVSGPVITPGCKWSVAAFDASGKPLAVSDIRPVSP